MINQQLLDYIKQSLEAGANKQQIAEALRAQGWQEQDIDEAFAAAANPAKVPTETRAQDQVNRGNGWVRKTFFVLFMIFYTLMTAGGVLLLHSIQTVAEGLIPMVSLIVAFLFINKMLRTKTNDASLQDEEKIKVIVTEFFNPIIVGAFYYYSWKKFLPTKAKQANRYSFLILLAQIIILIALYVAGLLH